MKLIVCGSREWTDVDTMRAWLSRLPAGSVVVHGAARGADALAGLLAAELGLEVRSYPADWKAHGKAAGPLRNQLMLDAEKPDRVWAFAVRLMRGSRPSGTLDMVLRAHGAGVACTVVGPRRSP